jgi:hypothetical protein
MTAFDRNLRAAYAVIAIAALIGTWSQNLTFFALPDNGGIVGFLRMAMVNPAAASLTIDLAFFCLAAVIWMVVEGRRVGVRFVWVYVALSFVIAISVTFPLFLIARDLQLARRAPRPV